MQVKQLNLFPIKSTRAYTVQQAVVQPQGLNFDREFMITEPDGTFITARKEQMLYRLSAFPISIGLVICDDQSEQAVTLYKNFAKSSECEVWGSRFPSWIADDQTNQWLSEKFGRPVQLRWLGEQSQRTVANFEPNPLSFADSNPILLVSEKSLEQVKKWSPVPVSMEQFRGNIVIDGDVAFEEEQWQQVQIGEVKFRFSQCCTRCILITRDTQTLELDPKAEPFRTLKQHHTNDKGKPIFGIHLVPENSGVIRVGDTLSILK